MFYHLLGKKNFSIDRLATLCHVAEAGSIGAATGNNPSQQSQYSRQIAELESFLGTDLLDRHSKPYRVTETGVELSRICRSYFSVLDDFVANCQGRPTKLIIGAGESHIQWLLIPGVLPRLRKELPEVSVIFRNLQSESIVEFLQNGEIDLGFVRKSAIPKTLTSTGNWKMGYRLFVPKRFQAQLRTPVSLDQIGSMPMAALEGAGEFRRTLETLSIAAAVDLEFQIECSSFTQVALMVARQECCAILPTFARSQLNEAEVNDYPVKGFKQLERTLSIAWNPKRAEIRPLVLKAAEVMGG